MNEKSQPRLSGREMMDQLQAMASQLAGDAPPVLREAAARAAELAATAARSARPVTERFLDAADAVSERFADRSDRFAADLRSTGERGSPEAPPDQPDSAADDPEDGSASDEVPGDPA